MIDNIAISKATFVLGGHMTKLNCTSHTCHAWICNKMCMDVNTCNSII